MDTTQDGQAQMPLQGVVCLQKWEKWWNGKEKREADLKFFLLLLWSDCSSINNATVPSPHHQIHAGNLSVG